MRKFKIAALATTAGGCSLLYFTTSRDQNRLVDYKSALKLCHSRNRRDQLMGLESLKNMGTLHDYKLQQICQSSDCSILAALILKKFSLKKFLKEKFSVDTSENLEQEIRLLLETLNSTSKDQRSKYFTNLALQKLPEVSSNDLETFYTSIYDNYYNNPSSFTKDNYHKRLLLYLKALEAQSTDENQCKLMIKLNIFDILRRLWTLDRQNMQILILKILANISTDEDSREFFRFTGWLAILEDCLHYSRMLQYDLLSKKILYNLTNDPKCKFRDCVYLIDNDNLDRCKEPILDIIFIHGLRGGLFYTWRQKDAPKNVTVTEKSLKSPCWPKDWLPYDVNRPVRVLAVDYDSYLSNWLPKCPDVKIKNTLNYRSKDMLKKLRQAGVGQRPIIFVAHSMGGLAVKKMLNLIDDEEERHLWADYDSILENTKGCIFYSTPHFGSPVATKSYESKLRFLLLPSVEVSELVENYDSMALISKFLKYALAKSSRHTLKNFRLPSARYSSQKFPTDANFHSEELPNFTLSLNDDNFPIDNESAILNRRRAPQADRKHEFFSSLSLVKKLDEVESVECLVATNDKYSKANNDLFHAPLACLYFNDQKFPSDKSFNNWIKAVDFAVENEHITPLGASIALTSFCRLAIADRNYGAELLSILGFERLFSWFQYALESKKTTYSEFKRSIRKCIYAAGLLCKHSLYQTFEKSEINALKGFLDQALTIYYPIQIGYLEKKQDNRIKFANFSDYIVRLIIDAKNFIHIPNTVDDYTKGKIVDCAIRAFRFHSQLMEQCETLSTMDKNVIYRYNHETCQLFCQWRVSDLSFWTDYTNFALNMISKCDKENVVMVSKCVRSLLQLLLTSNADANFLRNDAALAAKLVHEIKPVVEKFLQEKGLPFTTKFERSYLIRKLDNCLHLDESPLFTKQELEEIRAIIERQNYSNDVV